MGGSYQWPSVEETVQYRREVRQIILDIIDETPLELPVTMESKWVCERIENISFIICSASCCWNKNSFRNCLKQNKGVISVQINCIKAFQTTVACTHREKNEILMPVLVLHEHGGELFTITDVRKLKSWIEQGILFKSCIA